MVLQANQHASKEPSLQVWAGGHNYDGELHKPLNFVKASIPLREDFIKVEKLPPSHQIGKVPAFPLLRSRLHSTPPITAASIDGFDLAAGVGIKAMHHGHR